MPHVEVEIDEVTELKARYELSERNLKCLKKLANAAIVEYQSLQTKYVENQKQYEDLRGRLRETEEKLVNLQNFVEPACNEFNNRNAQLQIEKACSSEAMKFAAQKNRENNKLKRQSQMLLEKLNSANVADLPSALESITENETAEETTVNGDSLEQQCSVLNQKISALESQVKLLESKLVESENHRVEAEQRENQLKKKHVKLEAEFLSVFKQLQEHEQAMRIFTQASERAVSEFSELKDKYQSQLQLASAAESFAHKLYKDNEALKRQSTVLMDQSVLGDARLMKALMEIEDLTKQLETAKQENKKRMKELQVSLDANENLKRVNDLEVELQLTTSEVARLQGALTDMEEWKEKLVAENEELKTKLGEALRPPPPPPPPPCPLLLGITSTQIKIVKKTQNADTSTPATASNSQVLRRSSSASANPINDLMQEMMQRITNPRRPSEPSVRAPPPVKETQRPSPMSELQQLLSRMNRTNGEQTRLVSPSSIKSPPIVSTTPDNPPSPSVLRTLSRSRPPTLPRPSPRRSSSSTTTATSPIEKATPSPSTLPQVDENDNKPVSSDGMSVNTSSAAEPSINL